MCVYERVACVMERRRMLAGQIRGSECTAPAAPPAAARILDWVLSRFCLGFVSVFSRPTYHPTGGVIGICYSHAPWCLELGAFYLYLLTHTQTRTHTN